MPRGDRTGTGDAILDATLDAYYDLTGEHALGHISNPTPTQVRYAFADAYVALNLAEARGHASKMLAEISIHKAAPKDDEGEAKGTSRCAVCAWPVKRVPSGQGPTWIHTDTGTVAGPGAAKA